MIVGESILTSYIFLKIMRGRWASAAIGAGMARRRAGYEMDQQAQAYDAQQQQSQRQIDALQQQLEQQKQHPQEDLTEKLKKYADLKKQGLLTEEEFQKLKADLLSKL
ncbi:MAG: SHOCT domain-containing protein [Nitrososphaeraceae archaeon]